MNEKYKDTDLREALRRKYADTPKLPADFMKDTLPRREGRTRVLHWMAAAACLLLICGVGLTLMPKDEPAKTAQVIVKQTLPKPVSKPETPSSKVRNSQFQSLKLSVPKPETKPKQVPTKPRLKQNPSPNPSRGRGAQKASPRGGWRGSPTCITQHMILRKKRSPIRTLPAWMNS